ncbi:sulfite exporter TauE/SafE family protein [Salinisphaera aquimarina]|uniref:Probable membrane transporter protein n=1 Tax=Salinisphaera aquimarina TaxID=2094031 RepID=A0ABV7EPM8_9GAMM
MNSEILLPFLVVAAVAGYFQTVTGYGLGMILIGVTSGLDIVPVAATATIVGLLLLVNSAVALPGRFGHIHWPLVTSTALGVVPATLVGIVLLEYLDSRLSRLLHVALGLLIIYGAFSLLRTPVQQDTPSGCSGFVVSGVVSGLCGGLFGIPGPPLIYQFYRQPLPLTAIRNMLTVIFSLTATVRTLLVALQGAIDTQILVLTASAVPVIAVTTWLGRHCPPPLSTRAMRWLTCAVLLGIGSELIGTQLLTL